MLRIYCLGEGLETVWNLDKDIASDTQHKDGERAPPS